MTGLSKLEEMGSAATSQMSLTIATKCPNEARYIVAESPVKFCYTLIDISEPLCVESVNRKFQAAFFFTDVTVSKWVRLNTTGNWRVQRAETSAGCQLLAPCRWLPFKMSCSLMR